MYATDLTCLQGMPIFSGVDNAKLKLIAIAGVREEHPANEIVAAEGQQSRSVFIVLDGQIEIVRENAEVTVPIARFGPGYIIGDIAVLLGEAYPATFVAVTPLTVLRLDADIFMQLIRDVPQLSLALMRDLGRRVIRVSRNYSAALNHSPGPKETPQ
jgi:CRP-like cAMP-binding protein